VSDRSAHTSVEGEIRVVLSTAGMQPRRPGPLNNPHTHDVGDHMTAEIHNEADRLELALRSIQSLWAQERGLTDYSRITSPLTFEFPGVAPVWSIFLPDLLLDAQGRWRATEINVSNAAGTSSHRADLPRVEHEIGTLLAREIELVNGSVVLRPCSPDTNAKAEIYPRAALFSSVLQATIGRPVTLMPVREPKLPSEGLAVVAGGIPALSDALVLDGESLLYRGRRVVFMNNANLLAELSRRSGIQLADLLLRLDSRALHEGTSVAAIGFDKVRQQELCVGTKLSPVAAIRPDRRSALVACARELAAAYGGAVIKPDAASGGTSVLMVDPADTSRDVETLLEAGMEKMRRKYGEGWESTCALAAYEFVDPVPACTPRGPTRWDLRFEVLVEPTRVRITPLSARLCPEPVGRRLSASSAIANRTGRVRGEGSLVSALDLCELLGLDETILAEAAAAIYSWVERALSACDG
jgi:hypothetical protein